MPLPVGSLLVGVAAAAVALIGGLSAFPRKSSGLLCKEIPRATLEESLSMVEGNFSARYWQGDAAYLFPPSPPRRELARQLLPIASAWFAVGDEHLPNKKHSYSAAGGRSNAGRSTSSFSEGFTQVTGNINNFVAAAASLTDHLMAELGAPFAVNAYRAPQTGASLCPHNDAQDVIILQLGGCRTWTVWSGLPDGAGLERPFQGQTATKHFADCALAESGALDSLASATFELSAGDLLHIPRGMIHRTSRCGMDAAPSTHWTLTGATPFSSVGGMLQSIVKSALAGAGAAAAPLAAELDALIEAATAAPDAAGLALRTGLDSAVLTAAERGEADAGTAGAAAELRAALVRLQAVAEPESRAAGVLGTFANEEGWLEAQLSPVLRDTWLNSTWREKKRAGASARCHEIAQAALK